MTEPIKVSPNARDRAWTFHYRDAEGKRRTKNAPTSFWPSDKAGAEAWAIDWLRRALRTGITQTMGIVPRRETGPTIATLYAKWEPLRRIDPDIRPGTFAGNVAHFKHHILPSRVSNMPMSELLSPGRDGELPLVAFVKELRAKRIKTKTIARNTVLNIHTSLSALFTDAIDKRWIDPIPNPMQGKSVRKSLPDAETVAGEVIQMTADELTQLLTAEEVPFDRRVLYRVVSLTGTRAGEAQGLKWSDLKTKEGVSYLAIDRQCATYGSNGWASLDETKSKYSRRSVPLHPIAEQALEVWKEAWVAHVGRVPTPLDPIFPDTEGNHARPRSADLLRRDLGKAGLPTHVNGAELTFHAIRRTFVRLLEAERVPHELIESILGHTRKTTLGKHYSGVVPLQVAEEAIQRIRLPRIGNLQAMAWGDRAGWLQATSVFAGKNKAISSPSSARRT